MAAAYGSYTYTSTDITAVANSLKSISGLNVNAPGLTDTQMSAVHTKFWAMITNAIPSGKTYVVNSDTLKAKVIFQLMCDAAMNGTSPDRPFNGTLKLAKLADSDVDLAIDESTYKECFSGISGASGNVIRKYFRRLSPLWYKCVTENANDMKQFYNKNFILNFGLTSQFEHLFPDFLVMLPAMSTDERAALKAKTAEAIRRKTKTAEQTIINTSQLMGSFRRQ